MSSIFVSGSPKAAEDLRERAWREVVGAAVRGQHSGPVTRVGLHFALEPARVRIDLDNLVRAAISGIQDGGAIPRPIASVDEIVATKQAAGRLGLLITLEPGPLPHDATHADSELLVEADSLPRSESLDSKRRWGGVVEAAWDRPPIGHPVALDIEVRSPYSLVGYLKPIIDGMEAYLGRDPQGHLEFSPSDHNVTWLRIRRVSGSGPVLRVRATAAVPVTLGADSVCVGIDGNPKR